MLFSHEQYADATGYVTGINGGAAISAVAAVPLAHAAGGWRASPLALSPVTAGAARRDLEGAFGRPALSEMLREHARATNRKLLDVACAVVDGHRLLPKDSSASP